ncbi:MAG: sigma-70 family RNA polymerase sigma factor [Taibaiella sp.]|nr:sigma-70 family RNA polymerase sigma factor [Taibaiella sp.]
MKQCVSLKSMKTKTPQIKAEYKRLTDEELVYRYLRLKDHGAFNFLFTRYGYLVYGICMGYTDDVVTGIEYTKDIFMELTKTLKKFDGEGFRTWLLVTANEYCANKSGRSIDSVVAADTVALDEITVCVSPRQLKEYATDHMYSEEKAAIDKHLSSCAFCAQAVKSIHAQGAMAGNAVATLNNSFLVEHFMVQTMPVHLNSMAPSFPSSKPSSRKIQPMWRKISVAALFVLSFGILWFLEKRMKPREVSKEQQEIINSSSSTTLKAKTASLNI